MKRILWGLAGLLTLAVLAAAAFLWDPLPSNPPAEMLAAGAGTYRNCLSELA